MKKLTTIVFYPLFLLAPTTLLAQSQSQFTPEYDSVATIFEKNIDEYLKKFAENKIDPSKTEDSTQRIESLMYLYQRKIKKLRLTSYQELTAEQRSNKDFLLGYFSSLFTIEFPGLDYLYFKKCTSEVQQLKFVPKGGQ